MIVRRLQGMLAACALSALTPIGARAAEITIMASMGDVSGVRDLAAGFEKATGNTVVIFYRQTPELNKQVEADAQADLYVGPPKTVDAFISEGKIVAGSRVDFAKAGAGVAVRAGAPKPDISSVEAFKKSMLAAKSIGYSGGGSGAFAARDMRTLGIAEQLKGRTKIITGIPVAWAVANGEVEIGIQQINTLVSEPGTQFVGPLPDALQDYVMSSVGLLTVAKEKDAARAFMAFAIDPQNAYLIRKSRMEPWGR